MISNFNTMFETTIHRSSEFNYMVYEFADI